MKRCSQPTSASHGGASPRSSAERQSASTSSTYTASIRSVRVGEVSVQRPDADAGTAGDVFERCRTVPLGEGLTSRGDQRVVVARASARLGRRVRADPWVSAVDMMGQLAKRRLTPYSFLQTGAIL